MLRARLRKPVVCIITPYPVRAANGNAHTAARWARMLRTAGYRVRLRQQWDGRPCDAMIALHAGRSADSIDAFAVACPRRPLIVALTGTDLYGGLDATARRSLDLATHLVVLNRLALDTLPPRWRRKVHMVLPSASPRIKPRARVRTFDVAVVGHLRAVKDPRLPMRLARKLPDDSRIRLLHVGKALERGWSRAARATARATRRYRWLGAQSPAAARALIARSQLLLHPSRDEGGATVIVEALQSGTPVIASDCDGNVGLLGADYPGLFPVGDLEAARTLVLRAETDPRFLRRVAAAAKRRARDFTPAREARALRVLLDNSLGNVRATASVRPIRQSSR